MALLGAGLGGLQVVFPGQVPLHEGLRGGGWRLWRTEGPFWARLLCSACPAPPTCSAEQDTGHCQVGRARRLLVNQAKDFSPPCDQEPRAGEPQTLAHLAGGQGRQSAARGSALGWSWGALSLEWADPRCSGQRSRWGLAFEEVERVPLQPKKDNFPLVQKQGIVPKE